ncbi:hypothetical protein [Streptosporangium sp. NPDC051022]|uniref:hypothetical protein n=1 Tax=Streptosporangium sp. NPDC051022 TaxID=3155752 RepID=UPI0034155A2A
MTELPGPEFLDCPTLAGHPCGCCLRCLAQQVEALRRSSADLYGSPSDLDFP